MSIAEPGHAVKRQRLPNRRLAVTEAVAWRGGTWLLGVGFDPAGRVREAFLDGPKTGTDYEALMDDACVMISLLLQLGLPAPEIAARLGQVAGDPADAPVEVVVEVVVGAPESVAPRPASPIGLVAGRLAVIEAECGPAVREAYASAGVVAAVSAVAGEAAE